MSNARNQRRPLATLRPAGPSQPYALKPVFPPVPDVFFEEPRSHFSDDSSSPLSSPSPSPAQVVKANRAQKANPTVVQLQVVLPQAPPPADVRSPTPSNASWRTATPPPVIESESESESEPTASTSQIPKPVFYHGGKGGSVKALAGTGTGTGALVMAAAMVAQARRGLHNPYQGAPIRVSPRKPTPEEPTPKEPTPKKPTPKTTKAKAVYRHAKVRKTLNKKATNENEPPVDAAPDNDKSTARRRRKPVLVLPLSCLRTVLTRRKNTN